MAKIVEKGLIINLQLEQENVRRTLANFTTPVNDVGNSRPGNNPVYLSIVGNSSHKLYCLWRL